MNVLRLWQSVAAGDEVERALLLVIDDNLGVEASTRLDS